MDVVPYCKICSKQKKTQQEHFSCLTSYIIAYEKWTSIEEFLQDVKEMTTLLKAIYDIMDEKIIIHVMSNGLPFNMKDLCSSSLDKENCFLWPIEV